VGVHGDSAIACAASAAIALVYFGLFRTNRTLGIVALVC
jgi:hypothetical protein